MQYTKKHKVLNRKETQLAQIFKKLLIKDT